MFSSGLVLYSSCDIEFAFLIDLTLLELIRTNTVIINHQTMFKTSRPKIVFHFHNRTCQLLAVTLLLTGFQSNAQIIYVDKQLSADCAGNYSIINRDCSGSDGDAYTTFQSAADAAVVGTQVLIREGEYNEQLSHQHSGEENNYITFKNFENEVVEISGESLNPAIWIDQKDYIIIEGLHVHDVDRWLNALGCQHIIVRDNKFERALNPYGSSKTGIFMQTCSHAKIVNNIIRESTQDNIGLIDCEYSLIEGNNITKATHVLWTLKCSNYNIIRGNYFLNELQKIGEIYDCHNSGYGSSKFPKLFSEDDTKYNVVENNIFAYTPSPEDRSPYAGIQYAGQNGIIRNNIFYECEGPPLDLTLYGEEATHNYGNRISHNVFYNNDFGGISVSGNDNYNFGDQKIKNNILFKNQFVQRDFRWSWYEELNNKPVQIMLGRDSEVLFEKNNIFNSEVDELYVIAYGTRTSSSNDAPKTLGWWETSYSEVFKNNLQTDPKFVDETSEDFHLLENSPMIDAGTFLTRTTNSGAGITTMEVDDAGWFIDGFGIVSGDTIQLEGQNTYAIIISIDYPASTLTLDRAGSWDTGLGVSLKYNDDGPDLGAYEYSSISSGIAGGLSTEKKASIVPNPSNGLFTIELGGMERVEKVSVLDISGKQVMVAHSSEVNISDLDSGVYFLSITCGNGRNLIEKAVKY